MRMEAGSEFTYLSKRKLQMIGKKRERESKRVIGEVEEEEDEGYLSCASISDEELDNFGDNMNMNMNKQAMVKSGGDHRHHHRQEVDTNVVAVKLNEVNKETEIATGDPNKCLNCQVFLSRSSRLEETKEAGEYIWECEFCNYGNKLFLEEEEKPKDTETISYILEQTEEKKEGGGIRVIFCIDTSGSMCCTQQVDQKFKYMENESWASRLECVKLSIDSEISRISSEEPQTEIGLVLFSNKVEVRGDCTSIPHTIPSELYDDYDMLHKHVEDLGSVCEHTLEESSGHLLEALTELEAEGGTALGPGLLAATIIAGKGNPGSKVFLCTDGLSNVGFGTLDDPSLYEHSQLRYNEISEEAMKKGVSISLISLVSEECRLDMLSPIANNTGGSILRVQPTNLSTDFHALFSEKVLATNASLRVQLHKALQFRNEESINFPNPNDTSLIQRLIGNITTQSIATFEYMLKRPEELAKYKELDLENMTSIPFQAQLYFTKTNGAKYVRVISMQMKITQSKEEAKEKAEGGIIEQNALLTTAKLAKAGKFRAAQANAAQWGRIIEEEEGGRFMEDIQPLYSALNMEYKALPPAQNLMHSPQGFAFDNPSGSISGLVPSPQAPKPPQIGDALTSAANLAHKKKN